MATEFIHTFAGNMLDRADYVSRHEGHLDEFLLLPGAQFLPFWQLQPLFKETPELGFVGFGDLKWSDIKAPPVFLGLMAHVPYFAVDVSCQVSPTQALDISDSWSFQDSHMTAMALPGYQASIFAQARARVDWHARHQFCAACGRATVSVKGGQQRNCNHCGSEHFPRTDPVVIMLIDLDDQCLLGQSHGMLVERNIWSTLAGFIEQGESIEEAVRREVMEEAGIKVGAVHYHSSQPWPFPSSLMIGCLGQALSADITVDKHEMHDVRWFDRDEVLASLSDHHANFSLPGPMAIAHHLIKTWAEEKWQA